jgi:hypothetical protein
MRQPRTGRQRVRWPEELVRLRGGSLRKQRARDRFLAALLVTSKVGLPSAASPAPA